MWSHDGTRLAFASDRHGNFDVFVMPAAGGEAVRLTFDSAGETPGSFTADDTAVLFSATRQDPASNAQFPVGGMSELYSVPVAGGAVTRVLPVPAQDVSVSADGRQLIYHDWKGYESPWRKHHRSAVTRDVWVYDMDKDTVDVHSLGVGRGSAETDFVPRENPLSEDDGWLMSYAYDAATDSSEFVVLDALDVKAGPVARIPLPQRVPFGFHGSWISDHAVRVMA